MLTLLVIIWLLHQDMQRNKLISKSDLNDETSRKCIHKWWSHLDKLLLNVWQTCQNWTIVKHANTILLLYRTLRCEFHFHCVSRLAKQWTTKTQVEWLSTFALIHPSNEHSSQVVRASTLRRRNHATWLATAAIGHTHQECGTPATTVFTGWTSGYCVKCVFLG